MNNYRQPMSRNCIKDSCEYNDDDWKYEGRENIDRFPVGMCYVPWQYMDIVYEPDDALQIGTIFPELDKPFLCYRYSGGGRR